MNLKTNTKNLVVFVCKKIGKNNLWAVISLEHNEIIRLKLTKMDLYINVLGLQGIEKTIETRQG